MVSDATLSKEQAIDVRATPDRQYSCRASLIKTPSPAPCIPPGPSCGKATHKLDIMSALWCGKDIKPLLIIVRENRRPTFQGGSCLVYHVGDCMRDDCAYDNQSERRKQWPKVRAGSARPLAVAGCAVRSAVSNKGYNCIWFEHKV